ncbi:MAG: T9SS type A sorting domain-containing protein [Bacteroidia bacterium]|nr:T9SS type A sorting domain-containing protein [Bacteroidia bacterium]
MKHYLIILQLLFCFTGQKVFAQWTQLNSGINNAVHFNSVFFLNKDTGFIAVYHIASPFNRVILKTKNGGDTWEVQTLNFLSVCFAIFFSNNDTGYALGYKTGWEPPLVVLKTNDGGNNWFIMHEEYFYISWYKIPLFFTSSNTGYFGGGGILKTNDGGSNWIAVTPSQTGGDTLYFYNSIHFPTKSVGYAVGTFSGIFVDGALIYKTTDEGDNWILLTSFYQYDGVLQTVFFTDSLKGWVGGRFGGPLDCNFRHIFKTTDGGETWDTLTTAFQYIVNDIFFANESTGYVVDDKGYIYKTKDSGNSWETQYFANKPIRAIYCIDENICYAVGDSGLILKTINGGESIKENKNIQEILSIRPNPFCSSTEITVSIAEPTNVKLYLANIYGIIIKELINQRLSEGIHKVTISDSALAHGIYYCILETGNGMKAIKLVKL